MEEKKLSDHKLKDIPKISTLEELLDSCTLSSESTIKKKHKRILSKIGKII